LKTSNVFGGFKKACLIKGKKEEILERKSDLGGKEMASSTSR